MPQPEGKPCDRVRGTPFHIVVSIAAAALLATCAAPEDDAAEPTEPVATGKIAEQAPGVLPTHEPAQPEPSGLPAGLEPVAQAPAAPAISGPTAPSGARPGAATAYWPSSGQSADQKTPWRGLNHDGIHEKGGDAIGLLQEPRQAFRGFPRANSGNFVDWAAALREGIINPRTTRYGHKPMERFDLDVLLVDTKNMPYVVFPHSTHTEWLSCGNCHEWLFKSAVGQTDISMREIFRGRTCGVCHGRVAFPPTECFRCHSGPRPKG